MKKFMRLHFSNGHIHLACNASYGVNMLVFDRLGTPPNESNCWTFTQIAETVGPIRVQLLDFPNRRRL
jgi:hypothetical protein